MTDRHGGMAVKEEHRHRFADDIAPANDDGVLPATRSGCAAVARRCRQAARDEVCAIPTSLLTFTGVTPSTSFEIYGVEDRLHRGSAEERAMGLHQNARWSRHFCVPIGSGSRNWPLDAAFASSLRRHWAAWPADFSLLFT